LWNDTRGAADAQALVDALGGPEATALRIGSVPTSSFTVAHWAWLRRAQPEIAAAARHILLPHDYLSFRLTGTMTTDRSDVSGTGWWSPSEESYAADVLELDAVRLDPAYLPEVLGPTASAGTVTGAAAEQFGLRPGAPVACGAGDNAAGAWRSVLRPAKRPCPWARRGRSTPLRQTERGQHRYRRRFRQCDGRYLPLACTLNATVAVDQVSEWLGLGREDVASADEVVFLPWLGGERTPNAPSASGTLTGVRYSTDKRSILQAAYDGLVATLLEATAFLDQWAPQSREAPLLLLGGGARGRPGRRRCAGCPAALSWSSSCRSWWPTALLSGCRPTDGRAFGRHSQPVGRSAWAPARACGARRAGDGPHRCVASVVPRHLVSSSALVVGNE